MAASLGLMEILLLIASAGGMQTDFLALIATEDYFKQHEVEVKISTMLDRAAKKPTDAPTQAAQLLAIRWLGEHATARDEKVRALLQPIADGKEGQDAQGFARDYARRALARLDGKPAPVMSLPPRSVSEDALAWFPAAVTLAGALDLRGPGPVLFDARDLRQLTVAKLPPEQKDMFIKLADELGNVQVDRIAMAHEANKDDKKKDKITLRITGRADHKRLAAFLRKHLPKATLSAEKGPKDIPITVVMAEKQPPVFALVGDTDLLIAGYEDDAEDHREVMRDALDVLNGKKPALARGVLAGLLKYASPDARVLIVGEPTPRQAEVIAGVAPGFLKPERVFFEASFKKDLNAQARLTMANADAARSAVDALLGMKKEAQEQLGKLPAELKLPRDWVEELKKTVGGAKVYSEEKTLRGEITIPATLFKAVPDLLKRWLANQ